MTAPDTTGGELRERAEAICMNMPGLDFDDLGVSWHERIAYVEDALRDLLAERDKLAAQVKAVEEVHRPIDHEGYPAEGNELAYCAGDGFVWPCPTSRALGTPTTGGGE